MTTTLCTAGVDDVLNFMSQASSYPDRPSSVQVIETHISWVFLTDQFAYKLKKPVKFDFLDFSTLELRRRACQDELRLNRRLAPDVYVAVLPVTQDSRGELNLGDDGRVVDWVLQMRRLPAEMAVDVMLSKRQLKFNDATMIAQHLTKFYGGLPPAALAAEDYRRALERHVRLNGAALLEAVPQERVRIRRIQGAQLQYLNVEADLFDGRVEAGRVVEGHGDLRPEHIYLTEPLAIIDCVEFSSELRTVDVADELSFLAMECDRLGDGGLGKLVVAAYQRATGDEIPPTLLAFYRSYRACVRAKVAALRAQQEPEEKRHRYLRLTRQYMNWADHYVGEIGRPAIVIVGGLMGTGKSTFAKKLADAFGAELISTDQVRQSMLGPSRLPAGYAEGKYRPEMRDRIYEELLLRASEFLCKGQSVVLDGTFLTRTRRQRVYDLGSKHNAVPLYVLCSCPRQTALSRVQSRRISGGGESEARTELYDRQAAEFQPPAADESAVTVDTTDTATNQLQVVCDRLRCRMCLSAEIPTEG